MIYKAIVIMAGGSGTRLWPLSRKNEPKQFQALLSDKTLLEETFARALKIVPREQIYISTGSQYRDMVQALLPSLPLENIIIEPLAKNTAPAITLAAATIEAKCPGAHIATVASDHVIYNENEFVRVFEAAFATLEKFPDSFITIGINPTRPDTGFGYIQMGDEKTTINEQKVFTIENFQEKPDQETAEKYLAHWAYLWNAGYFIFSATHFLDWCKTYTPEIRTGIDALLNSANDKEETYANLPSLPVEPSIIEKLPSENRLVIPSALRWSDVGNWATLLEELQKLSGTSVHNGSNHIDVGSENLLVKQASSKSKLIATIGLDNIIVVETNDALLVAHKDTVATDIKDLLEKIKEKGDDTLL